MTMRPSETVSLLGVISPVSQGAGAVSSAWVSMAELAELLAVVSVGVLGAAATADAKLEQATDSSGTGVKDITGKAITQLTKAGSDDNKQALINLRAEELDVNGGFDHVRLTITVGVAASLVAGAVYGFNPRYAPKAHAATVDSVVA